MTNEKEELAQIKTKISNGVKTVLGGLNLLELKEALDRLRIRKSELEDIFQRRIAERPEVDPAAIVQLLQNAVDNWNPENLKEVLKSPITKIYAHVDGSYTVNVGVHISGKSTARGYNAPCFDGMVHYFMGSILMHWDNEDRKDRLSIALAIQNETKHFQVQY